MKIAESGRDPILSCSVKPDEMAQLKEFMDQNGYDGAKLIRIALKEFTGIDLSGTRHRNLVGSAPVMPTPQQVKFMKKNIKFIEQEAVTKMFASYPN